MNEPQRATMNEPQINAALQEILDMAGNRCIVVALPEGTTKAEYDALYSQMEEAARATTPNAALLGIWPVVHGEG